MSSGGCLAVFIILAIIFLIYLAPEITFNLNLDATLSIVIPIVIVGVIFIVALGFITKLVDDDDDDSGGEHVKVIEREKVLVVCPYCGAKNEQGATTCKNCDAEI
jgi:hypothetical protein